MSYQLLALDLDGTTLNSAHVILPQVKAALEKAKSKIDIMIVTGRHHTAARPYYLELGLDTPTIHCNGTYLYDYLHNKVLMEDAIPKNLGAQFIQLAQEKNLNMLMYVTDAMVVSQHQPVDFIHHLEDWSQHFPASIKPNIRRIDSFTQSLKQSQYLWKFVLEGDPKQLKKFIALPFIQTHFSAEQSWENRFDIAYKGNTKGRRLAQYLQMRQLDPSQMIAIGDNFNDISMLKLAGLGVAMAQAAPEVQACADFVTTEDNNGRGIIEVIEKFIL